MSAHILRPRVADLVFQAHRRPIHPEFFSILATRRIHAEGEITVHITRTGHVISWTHASLHLTEVAASEEIPAGQGRLLAHRLRGEHSDCVSCGPDFTYQTTFQVEALSPEAYGHVHDEIMADGIRRGLLYNFRAHDRLSLAPLGLVTVEARRRCLFFTSFHTFPSELTVVKTQSLIESR